MIILVSSIKHCFVGKWFLQNFLIPKLLVGIAQMLPLSAEAVRGKQKKPGVFSLNKIKPGMRLNQWPNVSSRLSVISVKVKGVGG